MGRIYGASRRYPLYNRKERYLSTTKRNDLTTFRNCERTALFPVYTIRGKARMKMKARLIFACMNPKKPAKIPEVKESKMKEPGDFLRFLIKQ